MPPPPPWSATLLPPPAMAARWALLLATPSLLPRANLLWLRAPRFSLVGGTPRLQTVIYYPRTPERVGLGRGVRGTIRYALRR